MEFPIFTEMFTAVDGALAAIVAKYAAIIALVRPALIAGVTIYIILLGGAILRGAVQFPFREFVYRGLKLAALCYAVSTMYGAHVGMLTMEGLPRDFANALGGANVDGLGGYFDTLLQGAFRAIAKITEIVDRHTAEAGTNLVGIPNNFIEILTAALLNLTILVIALLSTALGFTICAFALFALALLAVVGPLFLLHGAHSFNMAVEIQAKAVATDVPDEFMATSDVRPVEETMATRFASVPIDGRFDAIRNMESDDKMALLAGLVAMMVDGTVFAGGCPGQRHHQFEQIAKAAEVDVAARWSAPIAVFDRMKRPALITLLREQVGDASADNCATIKKKSDLAVNVSERLPGRWIPAPMIVGAFDKIEADDADQIDADQIESEDVTEEMA